MLKVFRYSPHPFLASQYTLCTTQKPENFWQFHQFSNHKQYIRRDSKRNAYRIRIQIHCIGTRYQTLLITVHFKHAVISVDEEDAEQDIARDQDFTDGAFTRIDDFHSRGEIVVALLVFI